MQYELTSVEVVKNQHPGFCSLRLLAKVNVSSSDPQDTWKPHTVTIPILAEPKRFNEAQFTCRIYSYYGWNDEYTRPSELEKRGITGLGSVPGLKEQARAIATYYWNAGFLPSVPIGQAGSLEGTLIPEIRQSTAIKLRFDELKLGSFLYSGEIIYRQTEDGSLVGSTQRLDLHVLLGKLPSGKLEHHSLNQKASKALIEYMQPRAKQAWDALKLERNAQRAKELRDAIACCQGTIASAQFQLKDATAKLPGLEAELRKVTEG